MRDELRRDGDCVLSRQEQLGLSSRRSGVDAELISVHPVRIHSMTPSGKAASEKSGHTCILPISTPVGGGRVLSLFLLNYLESILLHICVFHSQNRREKKCSSLRSFAEWLY